MSPTTLILSSVLLISFASSGYAIKCFQCDTDVYSDCWSLTANSTSGPFYKDCKRDGRRPNLEPICVKAVTTEMDVESRILRICVLVPKQKIQKMIEENAGTTANVDGNIGNSKVPAFQKCRSSVNAHSVKRKECVCIPDGCNI